MKIQICYPLNLPFVVSQKWGENYDYYYKNFKQKGHNGWDFAIPVGTAIYATHDGVVWFSGKDQSEALTVIIDSLGGDYRTFYGHLSSYMVTPGQKVKKGEKIGLSGNTGRYTTGPHLHFGIHPIANFQDTEPDNGWNGAVDPVHYFDGTYPGVKPEGNEKLKLAKFALRDWQVSVGILDFANETDYKKIKFGPKSQKLFNL